MKILITMAGEGSRFRNAGYTLPKHRIEVHGRTLFSWSIETLRNFYQFPFVFIARSGERAWITQECGQLGMGDVEVIEISAVTAGQAATVLLTRERVRPLEPIVIYNIDTFVEPHALTPDKIRGEGWLPAFEAQGGKWSFVACDYEGRVSAVTEKVRISQYGTIGLYYFSSFSLFEECYRTYSYANAQEHYVAPLYNVLLERGHSVYTEILNSKNVHVLGTPEDLALFTRPSN